jgi:hypothetical protein
MVNVHVFNHINKIIWTSLIIKEMCLQNLWRSTGGLEQQKQGKDLISAY